MYCSSACSPDILFMAGATHSNAHLQAEIEEAARLANAHSFICSLPHGYATQVDMPGCFNSYCVWQFLA